MAGKVKTVKCPVCGNKVRVRGDGQLAKHRHDGHVCPNGAA